MALLTIRAGACPFKNIFTRTVRSPRQGHETTDTDPGTATTKDDYSLETYLLSTNHYQIELLTNLDQVPESGDRCRQFSKT